VEVLAHRVARRDTRPLLRDKDPKTVLAALAAVRNPVYALAPIHVRSQPSPHELTVERIMRALNEHAAQ
jgi:shikimate kinase